MRIRDRVTTKAFDFVKGFNEALRDAAGNPAVHVPFASEKSLKELQVRTTEIGALLAQYEDKRRERKNG